MHSRSYSDLPSPPTVDLPITPSAQTSACPGSHPGRTASHAPTAKLAHGLINPAEARQIHHPLSILVLQELNCQWFRPRLECRVACWITKHLFIRLEEDPVMRDIAPFVVHINVELGACSEFETAREVSTWSKWIRDGLCWECEARSL